MTLGRSESEPKTVIRECAGRNGRFAADHRQYVAIEVKPAGTLSFGGPVAEFNDKSQAESFRFIEWSPDSTICSACQKLPRIN